MLLRSLLLIWFLSWEWKANNSIGIMNKNAIHNIDIQCIDIIYYLFMLILIINNKNLFVSVFSFF